jgi:O-antigen/teichoic acid export membrane protein
MTSEVAREPFSSRSSSRRRGTDVDPAQALPGPTGPGSVASLRAARLTRGVFADRSMLLLTAQVSTALVALLGNLLAARTLGAAGRGELALLLQLAYLSSLGVLLGTDRSLVTVYVGAPMRDATLAQLRLLVRPTAVSAALVVIAVWGLPAVGLATWRVPVVVTALFTVADALMRSTRAIAIAVGRYRNFLVATVAEELLLSASLCLLAVRQVSAVSVWIGAYVVTALCPAAVCLLTWAHNADASGGEDDRRRSQVRREGLQLVPSSLANAGMLRMDRILLAAMASTTALGLYASVSTFTELLAWPMLAYADTRVGIWRRHHDTGRLGIRGPLLGAGSFLAAGSLVMVVLASHLLALLGPDFSTAHRLIPPLVAAAGVLGLCRIVVALLIARRRNSWASVTDAAGFVVSLAAYATLIPHAGAAGAAWASLIGYSVSLAVGLTALALSGLAGRGLGRLRTPRGHAPVSPVPTRSTTGTIAGFALVMVALLGRYTLDRAGFDSLAWLDLRIVGLVVACAVVLVELHVCGGLKGHQPAGWVIAAMLFFGYQILSAAWSPPGADIGSGVIDLLTLAALTAAMYLHARTWPHAAGRRTLWLFWSAGVVFGLGAFLVTGPGVQGRYAAFGGGPNVFVRIEVLGLLAAVTLVRTGATRHLLWTAPLLIAGAIMSGSRGGLLAAAVMGLVVVVSGQRRTARTAVAASAAIAAVLTVAYRLNLPGTAFIRDRFVEQTFGQGYVSDRPDAFMGAVQLALDHPLTGAGLGSFHVLVGEQLKLEYAHNYVLSVAAEEGAAGLVLLGITVLLWLRTMVRARPWPQLTQALAAAALFVALASLASGDYYDSRFVWCCAALAVAGTGHPDRGTSSEARAEREAPEGELVAQSREVSPAGQAAIDPTAGPQDRRPDPLAGARMP